MQHYGFSDRRPSTPVSSAAETGIDSRDDASHHRLVTAVWTCPVCERKVPERVPECYCGVRKQQAVRYAQRQEAPPTLRRDRRSAVLLAAAGALLVTLVAWRPAAKALEPAVTPPATTVPLRVTTPFDAPAKTLGPPAPLVPVVEARRETPTPSPSAAASASTEAASPLEDTRVHGAEAFRTAAADVARQADGLRPRIRDYAAQCGSSPQMVLTIGCDDIRRGLDQELDRIARALDDADDAARRAWVEPGTRRQIRDQLRVDDGLAQLRRLLAEAVAVRP